MAIEQIRAASLEALVDFINNPENNIDHIWLYKNGIYIGSFLPKEFGKIYYDLEQISLLLYIDKYGNLVSETITITNSDFFEYNFEYV